MLKKQGFVVVQKSRAPEEVRQNPRYRGVDRLVPWMMENYQQGFDDPYENSKYASEGLIPAFPLAQEVLTIFTQIVAREDLEVLWIREQSVDGNERPSGNLRMQFLGFDVAGNGSPFYSIVSDFAPPDDTRFQAFSEQFNENGLFDSAETARNYLESRLRVYPEYRDQGIVVWEVFLAEDASQR